MVIKTTRKITIAMATAQKPIISSFSRLVNGVILYICTHKIRCTTSNISIVGTVAYYSYRPKGTAKIIRFLLAVSSAITLCYFAVKFHAIAEKTA